MADAAGVAGERIVTISAAFGAGGSIVGPAVAERLGLPFLDRAIPTAVARTLAVTVDAAIDHDERRPPLMKRILAGMASADTPFGVSPAGGVEAAALQGSFNIATEQVVRELVAGGGGVVLGRAGAVVLAGHPHALHVRLHGPRDARIARVMDHEHIDRDSAAKLTDQTDRAWESYVRYFYKADPTDTGLYHLVIDATLLTLETCADIIITAAQAIASDTSR